MKLFFFPGACSLSPHIVAREAGLKVELQKVDLQTKKTAENGDYLEINPKGTVPALQLDNGEVLTEGPAIVQFLANQAPDSGLAPAAGTMGRSRLQESLGYINSEIHKGFSPLFNPQISEQGRAESIENLFKRYGVIERQLNGHSYLLGDNFTAADAYLYTVTRWAGWLNVDLSEFPNVTAFQKRVEARPAVQAALAAETPS